MSNHEPFQPVVGDILALRLSQEDRVDIIPWLSAKGLHKGEWSSFLRHILRERIAVEQNPLGARSRDELAELVSNLVRYALRTGNIALPSTDNAASDEVSPEQAINANVMNRLRAMALDDAADNEDS